MLVIPSAAQTRSPEEGEVGVGVGAGGAVVAFTVCRGVYVGGNEIVGVLAVITGADGV